MCQCRSDLGQVLMLTQGRNIVFMLMNQKHKSSSFITAIKSIRFYAFFTITKETKPVNIDNNVTPKSKNYRMRIKVGGHECVSQKWHT